MTDDPHRTIHAQQAFEFGDVFGYKFDGLGFGSPHVWKLRLKEADGMSTAGGRQARQPLMLEPDDAGYALVCGWLDVTQRRGELRAYQAVESQYRARFQQRLDLTREEYDRMRAELEGFLRIQNIELTLITSAPAPATPSREAAPKDDSLPAGPLVGMLGLGIGIGFGLGYLVFRAMG